MKIKIKKILLAVFFCFFLIFPLSSCGFFDMGDTGSAISEITTKVEDNGDTTITIVFTDEEKEPVVFSIPKGSTGSTGNGIASITQEVAENGNVILTITFTDGREPMEFEVPVINGVDGTDGVSIEAITTTAENDGSTTVTISFEGDIDDVTFSIPKGEQGEQGNGIASLELVKNEDGSQTITITYSDSSFAPSIITIPAPEKGDTGLGIDFMVASETETNYVITVYYTDGTTQELKFSKPEQPATWLSGFTNPSANEGNDGDFYLNKSNLTIWQKKDGVWQTIAQLSVSLDVHTVQFDSNGGEFTGDTFSKMVNITHGQTFYQTHTRFPAVTKDGSTFLGWYTSRDQTDPTVGKFTDLTPVNSDMVLYAWWSV